MYDPTIGRFLTGDPIAFAGVDGNLYRHVRDRPADRLGAVADLAVCDADRDVTALAHHPVYSAFGTLTSQANAAAECLFGFTGRPLEAATGVQTNHNRWHDPAVGRWISEDPVGFTSRDANLSRYVSNTPTVVTDPSGLTCKHTFRPNVPDNLKEQALKNFDKALDELVKAGGLAADLARILKYSSKEWEIVWDMNAKPMQKKSGGGFGQSHKWLELNPQWATFMKPGSLPAAEEKGVTGAVVVGHELGHLILGFTDPENVTLVENEIRRLLNPNNPNLRPAYSGDPIPDRAAIPKKKWSDPKEKGVVQVVTPDEYIRRRLNQYLKHIDKHKNSH